MSTTALHQIDVHELLPQQEPFVMVSRLTENDTTHTTSELDILPSNLFVDDDHFTAPGLIEHIAQTCAARLGYVNKYVLHRPVQLGFIGAVRQFEVFRLPHTGQTIQTRIEVMGEVLGMTLVSSTTRCEGEVVATTELKIAIQD